MEALEFCGRVFAVLTFLRTKVRARFARAATSLNRYSASRRQIGRPRIVSFCRQDTRSALNRSTGFPGRSSTTTRKGWPRRAAPGDRITRPGLKLKLCSSWSMCLRFGWRFMQHCPRWRVLVAVHADKRFGGCRTLRLRCRSVQEKDFPPDGRTTQFFAAA